MVPPYYSGVQAEIMEVKQNYECLVLYCLLALSPPFNLYLGYGKKSMLTTLRVLTCEIEGVTPSCDPDTAAFTRVNIKRNVLENTHLSMKNSLTSGLVHTM